MEGAAQIDPAEFRSGQRQQWNSAAQGWRKWSQLIDRAAGPVSERLIDLAGIGPGQRVLDVAAGYGEPALTAAWRVGPQGSVVAADISAQMLAYGRERAEEAGLGNVEFLESDAMSLDFPRESFDAAVSRWGIIFEPDGEGAAARVRTFLKPESRFAIASWGEPEKVPFIALPMQAALEILGVPGPPPGTPGPLSRPTEEALAQLLAGGGFSQIEVEETEVSLEWESPEEFTAFIREIAPPISGLIAPHPPEVQDRAWGAITEAAREAAQDGGRVVFANQALLASGRA